MPGSWGRTAAAGGGLVALVVAAWILPMNVRDLSIALHRSDYAADTLELASYVETGGDGGDDRLEGHVVSSGEAFASPNTNVVPGGLEEVRRLARDGRLSGHRVPIAYLATAGNGWRMVDRVNPFRVVRPDELRGDGAGIAAAIAAGLWIGGLWLLRAAARRRAPAAV
ncbi:MAG: hypothetical protein R2745_15255 [Vicinamibacterales bacterium]